MKVGRIHRIAAPTPFPVGPANAYLIEGESPLLIDAGLRSDASFQAITEGVSAAGLRLEDIRRIVLTHHHVDHAGGAARVKAVSGATIFAHPGDRTRLAGSGHHPELVKALSQAGVPPDVLGRVDEAYFQIHAYHEPLHEIEPLLDGAVLETGAGPLRVLYTPGHTQGSVCFWGDDDTLFSGDTVLERITPNAVLDGEGRNRWRALPVYVRSLARLRDMRPKRVFPGHGSAFTDMDRVVAGAFARYRARGAAILELLEYDALTIFELGAKLFGTAEPTTIFLIISEVYGNLDLLEAHGAVEVVSENPLRYRAAGALGPDYPLT